MDFLGCLLFLGILAAAALGGIAVAVWLIKWVLLSVGLIRPARHKAYSRAEKKRGLVHEREDGRESSSGAERLSPLQLWRKEFTAFKSERDLTSAALLQYVSDAVFAGMEIERITAALTAKGWAQGEAKKGLEDFASFTASHPMPPRVEVPSKG